MSKDAISVALVSLGCPKNLIDSEKMLAALAEDGLVVGAPVEDADVIVVNTCGFVSAARDESLEVIAEALAHNRQGRTQRVVVAGCLVPRDAEKLYELAPGIDAIVGVHNRADVVAAVRGEGERSRLAANPAGPAASDAARLRLTPRHTAYLRVSEGCSRGCTFCTIPAIRGPLRSKPSEVVLAEARELVADGASELILIGQETTAYGSDLADAPSLSGLLRELDALTGLRWLRLLYAYPRNFDDDLIDAMAGCDRVVPYLDLPLQHINDDVLRRMGRGVTRREIEGLIDQLRRRVPGIVLRTTMIVGFPGETEKQFKELLTFVESTGFDALGAFAFSPEPGTPAAEMELAVDESIRTDRLEQLMEAQQIVAFEANDRRVGQRLEVLVDTPQTEDEPCLGRFYGQAPEIDGVCILTESAEPGTFVPGRVIEWEEYDLIVEAE